MTDMPEVAMDVKGLPEQFIQTARLTARINTDDAASDRVLLALAGCVLTWKADARLVGNVRAGDIARAVYENATALQSLAKELAEARAERDEADAEIVSTESLLAEERRMRFAAEAASASKDERIRELEARLAHYADQLCELGEHHECCGKMGDDECAGCRARAAVTP